MLNCFNFTYLKTIAFLMAVVFCFSCSSPSKNQKAAEETALNFLRAYYTDFNFSRAKELSLPHFHKTIDNTASYFSLSPFLKEEAKEMHYLNTKIDIKNKNKAIASYRLGESTTIRKLRLSKLKGKWFVGNMDENSSFFGFEDTGFASAASSDVLPTTGPGKRAREARERAAAAENAGNK